jgi:hypothetical protein
MATETQEQTEALAASPWRRAAKSLEGKAVIGLGLLGLLGTAGEKSVGFLERIGISNPLWIALAWLVLVIVAAAFYLLEVSRVRRLIVRRPTTAFIGVNPFTERDHPRFFGRDNEIEEIRRKLTGDPQLKFFILYGESGCGKTSLIRAGLIPALNEKDYDCATLYVRLYDHPEKSLREALRSIGKPEVPVGGRAQTLFSELKAAHARSGKGTLVLFIDQFQEFFINPLSAKERELFFKFVGETVGAANLSVKLMFALRSDFFHRMTDFFGYVKNVLQQSNTHRVNVFSLLWARIIIRLSLQKATENQIEGILWEDALIERVLDDLAIERRGGVAAETEPIVLPAELQIVCQMIQRRGWVEARQYTGKEWLIRDYLNEAIQTSPNPHLSNLVLLGMIHDNKITRAQPQTPEEIAHKISALNSAEALRHLEYLDVNYRLVSQVVRQESPDEDREIAYELTHEYLVNVISSLAGSVEEESRRANLALQEHRKRYIINPKYRVPIADYWRILKRATVELTAEDRLLLRRSAHRFAYRTGAAILLPVLLICVVRLGTVHFDVQHDKNDHSRVVVRRGLPYLMPLLGSDEILVNTGMEPDALTGEGKAACQNHESFVDFGARWSWRLKNWRKEKLLQDIDATTPQTVVRAAEELLKLKLADESEVADILIRRLNGRAFEQSSERDLSNVVDLLLRINITRDVIEQPLRKMWKNRSPGGRSAALLLRAGVQEDETIRTFCDRLRDGTSPYLVYLDSMDFDEGSPLLRYYSDKGIVPSTPYDGLNTTDGFILDRGVGKRELSLNDALYDVRHNYKASYDFSILERDGREAPNQWLIELLRERLTTGTAKEIVAAARTLAKLKIKSPWVGEIIRRRLQEISSINENKQSFTPNIEQQKLDEEIVALAAAHSLFVSEMSDKAVQDALQNRLAKAPNTIAFWLIVDFCARHNIKEQWLIDPLLNKLRNTNSSESEAKAHAYVGFEQEEPALAASALINLHIKDKELLNWVLRKLDVPETASKAAEDLGELGEIDKKLVTDALRQRLNAEMDEENEGDIPLLTAAANSLVKLGEHDQVVIKALHRSIEKARGSKEISQSAKTLHDLRELNQQGVTLLRNRLGDKNPLIVSAVAKMLADFNVRDETTLKTLHQQLDLSDSDVEEAEAYAKLALIDPKLKFEEQLEHLWQELVSPAADSSSGYRRAVQYAFKLSVEQQLNGKAGDENAIDALRTKLNELKGTAEIHRQLAANEILESIDEVVKKHKQENSD